jgi:hypothetical protein
METAVLSVRVKKSLKDEAEKMGIDLKAAVEGLLEELVAEKKSQSPETRGRTSKTYACFRRRMGKRC